jgi:hypothetical protein
MPAADKSSSPTASLMPPSALFSKGLAAGRAALEALMLPYAYG